MAGANGKPANVLTKQDHRASTGIFPSDRNGHVRSGSYGSEKGVGAGLGGGGMGGNKHTSLRSLPPIVESKRNSVVDRRSMPIYRGGELPT